MLTLKEILEATKEAISLAADVKELPDLLTLLEGLEPLDVYLHALRDVLEQEQPVFKQRGTALSFHPDVFRRKLKGRGIDFNELPVSAAPLTDAIGEQIAELLLDSEFLFGVDIGADVTTSWAQRMVDAVHRRYAAKIFARLSDDATRLELQYIADRVKDNPQLHSQLNEINSLAQAALERLPPKADLETLRADYLDYLQRYLAYLDLGGIAPKVANRTVKLPMADIFVPVEASRELDVQQAWQQLWSISAEALGKLERSVAPSSIKLLTKEMVDKYKYLGWAEEAITAVLVGEGAAAAMRIFQERLAHERPAKETASIQDILATPRAVLLGHPGTGKSTTLKYAAYAIASRLGDLVGEKALDRLPILLRLVDYAQEQSKDSSLRLRDYVRDRHDKDRAPLFRQCLESGECLVMLDGLDEVIDPRQRADIADQVEALVADYPDNHYLVASRVVGYQAGQLTGDFGHFTLGPLPESSIHGFVHKWYEAIEQESGVEASEEVRVLADDLVRAIEERPGIRRLAENPLLLTIIALVNWKGRRLPNRRVEVYSHAAETLVESWPARWRNVSFDAREVLGLLEPVAYRIFADRSSQEIAESELLPLLVQAVVETKPGLDEAEAQDYVASLLPRLSEHSGLLLERGFDAQSGERLFGFLHLTFAEYLAARHLAGRWEAEKDDESRRAFLARYAHVPRWREVVLLMADHVGMGDVGGVRATRVLADLLQMEAPYEEHLHRNLLLAGQCLADDLRVRKEASVWVLDRLAALVLETPIEPLRETSAGLAQQMEGTVYEGALMDRLLARLGDESEVVRSNVALSLGQIENERAVEGLLAWLEDDSADVRASAARALGEIKSERAVGGLLARLEDDSADVRGWAAMALGLIKSERAVEGLLARLEDESADVRGWAAMALGLIESGRAAEGLLARLEDESEKVYVRAAWALGEIKSGRAEEDLLARLEDDSAAVRARAAGVLGVIKSERAVDGLLAWLEDDSAAVRHWAAWALGEIKSERRRACWPGWRTTARTCAAGPPWR